MLTAERKCKPLINYFRNTTQKQTFKTRAKQGNRTRRQVWRGNSYAWWHTDDRERGSVTRESDGDLKIFSTGNRHSNPRRGERSMEAVGSDNDNEIPTEGKGQPVPRIGE